MNDENKTTTKNGQSICPTPRLMIAAPSSGSGKTVLTIGLLRALSRTGRKPVSFKCGPDYIDPMFHRTVLGIDSLNLDTFFSSKDQIRRSVDGCDGDIAVIEGVMGIFDGISPDSVKGSCYEIAAITDTPVILAVNAAGAGRTVISLIKGILADDDRKLIKGIILNRISPEYCKRLLPCLEEEIAKTRDDVLVIGHIPKDDALGLNSRHLGLALPSEVDDIRKKIELTADLICEGCDMDALMYIAENVPAKSSFGDTNESASAKKSAKARPVHLAVARDEAFCFYYRENLRLLEKMGVVIDDFSPLRDEGIPVKACGILLGGGYPELHLEALSANEKMLASIKDAIGAGMPSLAECGGFMYFHDKIEGQDKKEYRTLGVIDGKCTYTGRLVNFGYTEVTGCENENGWSASSLAGLKGHEFHYYDSTCNGSDLKLRKPSSGKIYEAMIKEEGHLWGFPHFYYPSQPGMVERFVEMMRGFGS